MDPLAQMPVTATTNLSALSSLLTQLQALNGSDLRLLPATPEQRQYIAERAERDRLQTQYRAEREHWDHVKNLISDILKDIELQRDHKKVQSVLVKCQQALTRLRLYGSADYHDNPQGRLVARIQTESVFNQLVYNIKTVYTLEDKPGYSPLFYKPPSSKILVALESIVHEIIHIGDVQGYITHYQLMTEQDWKSIIPRCMHALDEYLYDRRTSGDEAVHLLSVLKSKLDTQLTKFIARPITALNIYNSMVDEIESVYEHMTMGTSLHIIIICLMAYGRKYSFHQKQIEALDVLYWRDHNPRGFGLEDVEYIQQHGRRNRVPL